MSSQIAFESSAGLSFTPSPAGARNEAFSAFKWFWRHWFGGSPRVTIEDKDFAPELGPPYIASRILFPSGYHGVICVTGNHGLRDLRNASSFGPNNVRVGTGQHLQVLFRDEPAGTGEDGFFTTRVRVWGICPLTSLNQHAVGVPSQSPSGTLLYDQNIPITLSWGPLFPSVSYAWSPPAHAVILNGIQGPEVFGLYDVDRTIEVTAKYRSGEGTGDLRVESALASPAFPVLGRLLNMQYGEFFTGDTAPPEPVHEPNLTLANPTSPIPAQFDPPLQPGDRPEFFRRWGPLGETGNPLFRDIYARVGLAVHLLSVERVANPKPTTYIDHKLTLVSKIRS